MQCISYFAKLRPKVGRVCLFGSAKYYFSLSNISLMVVVTHVASENSVRNTYTPKQYIEDLT